MFLCRVAALTATLTACELLVSGLPASASVVDSFSANPNVILAGQSTTLDLQLTLSPDGSDFNAQFTGGTVTFYSGTGASTTVNLPEGGLFQNLSTSFLYPNAGLFTPTFSANVDYTENYTAYGIVGYSEQQYVEYYQPVYDQHCGFGPCPGTPVYGYQQVADYGYYTATNDVTLALSGSADLDPEAAPLPAALPLFASGLAGIGFFARRRKKSAEAPSLSV